jgi:hypothetical protein
MLGLSEGYLNYFNHVVNDEFAADEIITVVRSFEIYIIAIVTL